MHLLFLSIHGLIRGHDLELGRDPDTGGQTQYVVELARALARLDKVERVDLVTRRIVDPGVSSDYAERIEELGNKARIVRIDAGPEEYIPKEELWDHLDSFTDNLMAWLAEEHLNPTLVHSHYADAGYVGVRVSHRLGIPLVHTGHSLGRDKRRRLMATGMTSNDIETRFNMERRIDAEEQVLANADLVVGSTDNEIEQQYGAYHFYRPESMAVIPPGTDLSRFRPPEPSDPPSTFEEMLPRFLRSMDRPMILALSRPDQRKNIKTLVEAFGETNRLRDIANLVIIAGIRDDIRDLDSGPQSVLTEILLLIDYYNLYGRVAIPKNHRADQVPEIYRAAAKSRGIFVNPALTEPFGLTLLEAAATGLPIVATENGGPVDIIANCGNGILVNPLDSTSIADALVSMLDNPELWTQYARSGLRNVPKFYSWDAHASTYISKVEAVLEQEGPPASSAPLEAPLRFRDRAVFTDIDQNLIGNPVGLSQLMDIVHEHRRRTVFGIATGRNLQSALSVMKQYGIMMPDVLITSLGTQIHYAQGLIADEYWTAHIDHHWQPQSIRRTLAEIDGLKPQSREHQSRFKVSYHYDPAVAPSVEDIIELLRRHELTVNVIHSFGQYLDVLPARASKGEALRYVARGWDIPLARVLVAGGSGADEDMMRGNTMAVVVANRHHEELSGLDERDRIFCAQSAHALGIIEAMNHYGFFSDIEADAD